MTFRIRSFSDDDTSTLAKLLNESRAKSYEFIPITEEQLHSWTSDPDGRLKVFIAEENSGIIGSGAYHDGHWGEEVEWLIVRESPDQKLIERVLVEEVEKCVKRGAVFTPMDAESQEIDQWIERGYRVEGGLYHMVAKLGGLKSPPPIPEGIVLRSLNQNEEKELVDAVNIGFGWERLKIGDLQTWKTEDPPFTEEWVQIGESDRKIVSVVASRPDTRYNKSFNGKRGYLGPATTLPEYRGKNIASALTVRAMNLMFEKGMDSAALYTVEQNIPSVSLLRKIDFEIRHHWRFMRKNFQSKNESGTPEDSIVKKC
jgi:ribosomal protein S18 acetylase RimI-like enzyme